jgi:WhiB family redox-sensing transcriptional regulator
MTTTLERLNWRYSALCAQVDPEEFFLERSSLKKAKAVCAECPVARECLEYALAADERFGVWGGQTQAELERTRKARGIVRIPTTRREADLDRMAMEDRLLPQYEALIANLGSAADMARELGLTTTALSKRMERARRRRDVK